MLVSDSIYSACRIFDLFQQHRSGREVCHRHLLSANPADIKGEESREGIIEKLREYDVYRKMLTRDDY